MMTNPIRDTVYTVTVPVDLTAAVLAACRAEAAAGIKRAPTPMMRVLPPLTAAAACAAVLGVALYLGGNTPDDLPVLPPVGNEDTTTEVTETTDSTAKPTTKDTTTTTTAKPTTTTTTEKTTTTTTEPYILVGGEDDLSSLPHDSYYGYPSLKKRLVSPTLEEKMKEYRDVNAVFQVGVMSAYTIEDDNEILNLLKTDEEYQSLKKQREAASEAYKEAEKRFNDCEYPDDDPRREDLQRKVSESSNEVERLREKLGEYRYKLIMNRMEERLLYAAKYSKTEPVSGFGINGNGYYMHLTADAINELADRGGYEFYLASDPEEIVFGRDM